MKLIKAHVINFGKLHDFDIDFTDGVNSFMQENGWGKTTFSSLESFKEIDAQFMSIELVIQPAFDK